MFSAKNGGCITLSKRCADDRSILDTRSILPAYIESMLVLRVPTDEILPVLAVPAVQRPGNAYRGYIYTAVSNAEITASPEVSAVLSLTEPRNTATRSTHSICII